MKIASSRRLTLLLLLTIGAVAAQGAELKTRNVFLVISDGLRWQEVFNGAEESFITKQCGVSNTNAVRAAFWRQSVEDRRAALMPFFWKEIAQKGQLYGNQAKGSMFRVTNGKNFSYPGYGEMLTGYGDPRIDSNDKLPNPNVTVFEWIERQKEFGGKVAVFGTWDVFPFIFNCGRSQLPIWPAWGNSFAKEIKVPEILRRVTWDTPRQSSDMVYDSFAIQASLEYLKRAKPRLLFVGLGDTDETGHHNRYDEFLNAAHRLDAFVNELWMTAQSMSQYRDRTTILVTADHGRGSSATTWQSHGAKIPESEGDWLAVIGPDTAPLGERSDTQNGLNQVASTIAALLGLNYQAFFSHAGEPLQDVIKGR